MASSSSSSSVARVRADLQYDPSCVGGSAFWQELFAQRRPDAALCLAPLHESSDLPLRVLMREQGQTDFCFTPMIHSRNFRRASDEARELEFRTVAADRPLVVQFCTNDATDLIESARFVQHRCDAIDINLGCPQASARTGDYGAFFCEKTERVCEVIRAFRASDVQLPLWVKIRVLDSVDATVAMARQFEAAGVSLITVHGRTRKQIGPLRGDADEAHIAAVVRALRVPVIANGNVRCRADALRIGRETGAVGVMAGWWAIKMTPFVFCETPPTTLRSEMALAYWRTYQRHPVNPKFARKHVFEYLQPFLLEHGRDFFDRVARAQIDDLEPLLLEIQALEQRIVGSSRS